MAEVQTAAQTASNIVEGIKNKASGKAPTEAAPDPKTPAAPVDPNAGKEKYVVEGREVWLSPEQARAYVQKGIAFEPRMDQLARLQQETQMLQQALVENPGAVLANIAKSANVSMKEMVQRVLKGNASDDVKESVGQWYYENEVEPRKLSPEQLKAREDARWRADKEADDKKQADLAIQRDNQAKVAQAFAVLRAQVAEAMKESGLPSIDTPLGTEMAKMVAQVMQLARRQQRAITPKEAIQYVKTTLKERQVAFYDSLEAEDLVKELGEKNAEKVRKHFLKLASATNQKPTVGQGKPRAAGPGERKNVISPDDMAEYLADLKKRG